MLAAWEGHSEETLSQRIPGPGPVLAAEKERRASLGSAFRVSKVLSPSREDWLWAVIWLVAPVLPYPGSMSQSGPGIILPASPCTPTPGRVHEVLGRGSAVEKLIGAWQNVPCPWGSRSTDHQLRTRTPCSGPRAAHVAPCTLSPQGIRKTGTHTEIQAREGSVWASGIQLVRARLPGGSKEYRAFGLLGSE